MPFGGSGTTQSRSPTSSWAFWSSTGWRLIISGVVLNREAKAVLAHDYPLLELLDDAGVAPFSFISIWLLAIVLATFPKPRHGWCRQSHVDHFHHCGPSVGGASGRPEGRGEIKQFFRTGRTVPGRGGSSDQVPSYFGFRWHRAGHCRRLEPRFRRQDAGLHRAHKGPVVALVLVGISH